MYKKGQLYYPLSSRAHSIEILIKSRNIDVYEDGELILASARVKSIQNHQHLNLEGDYAIKLQTKLTDFEFAQLASSVEQYLVWLEKITVKKVIILCASLALMIFGYRAALVAISNQLVRIFPDDWEQVIGKNSYQSLLLVELDVTKIPENRRLSILAKAEPLILAADLPLDVEIFFHSSPVIGANALAFPGGPIVLTDDLIIQLEQDEFILAVLAHELAHVKERHTLQQIFEVLGVLAITSMLFGGNDSILEEASAVGANLLFLRNSRSLESEADSVGVELLKVAGLAPSLMSEALSKLFDSSCLAENPADSQTCYSDAAGWLSSHPDNLERLANLEMLTE